jgi:hypothetical protein
VIRITYSNNHPGWPDIRERLEQMSLAYRHQTVESEDIQLEDGEKQISGSQAIHRYLDQLAEELHQWYYCSC